MKINIEYKPIHPLKYITFSTPIPECYNAEKFYKLVQEVVEEVIMKDRKNNV